MVWIGSARLRSPVWTASGMGHWKGMIKIINDTDCYYCVLLKYLARLLHDTLPLCSVLNSWFSILLDLFTFVSLCVTCLYLHDWATSLWSCTCVLACARHLLHFAYSFGCLQTTHVPACPDLRAHSRSIVDLSVEDQAFLAERVDQL